MHAELDRIGAPRDLVLQLPAPVTRENTYELMRAGRPRRRDRLADQRACRVFERHAGDRRRRRQRLGHRRRNGGRRDAAAKIARSKTFDNATRCSSENSVIAVAAVYDALVAALEAEGGALLTDAEARKLEAAMFAGGKLVAAFIAQAAGRDRCASRARSRGSARREVPDRRRDEASGREHPFSGEKLSPVLALYRAEDFDAAAALADRLLRYQGAGHSIGLHTRTPERALQLGLTLPVCRVIVNQAHCFATGGSFDNALPFSLSMGCGTWGGNSISDNLNYRHFLNITRVVHPLASDRVRVPTDDEFFAEYRRKHGL